MRTNFGNPALLGTVSLLATTMLTPVATAGDTAGYKLKTLYSFCVQSGCPDGDTPSAGVLKDPDGTLYGIAGFGGKFGDGTAFSLTPKTGATYKFHTIYSFCKQVNCADGYAPDGQMVEDTNGNLYGVTAEDQDGSPTGTIFRLSPSDKGWKFKVIYSFCSQANCSDGGGDYSGLSYKGQAWGKLWDRKSPLFGSTPIGGANGNGTIFELMPSGSQWDYTVIHNIASGKNPQLPLVDRDGNLFITSETGGANNFGNLYTLATGTWKETTIHNFCPNGNCSDGSEPAGTLALDADGNVYGVTLFGGSANNGVVFEHPVSGGFAVTYNFCGDGSCGSKPENLSYGNVSHNLFGITYQGGVNNKGVVYQLAFKNGIWNETVIEDFCADGNCTSGANPGAPILEDESGNLFSTTSAGGNLACNGGSGCGTVFELKKN